MILTSCTNTYYNRFGGYPINSETLEVNQDAVNIKLLVTYRFFQQNEVVDTTSLNISIKPIIDQKDLPTLKIVRIALASQDSSYLLTYSKPAVYDKYGKYPIIEGVSDQPCVFTVKRGNYDYNFILTYSVIGTNGQWIESRKVFPINIQDKEMQPKTYITPPQKIPLQTPKNYPESRY